MTIEIETGFVPANEPLTHARILHSRNWLAGTPAASGTAADFFEAAPDNTLTYEFWKPDAMPATWEIDVTSGEANCCCLAAHTLGTAETTVTAQYWDGALWQDIVSTQPSDDSPIMMLFDTVMAARFRAILTGSTAPEIGVIKFGLALEMQRPIYGGHTPVTLARRTRLRSNTSETGEFLGRTKQRTMLSTDFSWRYLTAAWVRANWPDLQRGIETEPFWIAWRPASFGEVGFAQVDDVPVPTNMGARDLMSVDMRIRARGYD